MKKKIDMSQFESEIAKAEEMFLKLGASRMSEYFGVKNELDVRYGDIKAKSDGKFAYPDDFEEIHNRALLWLQRLGR